MAIGNQTKNTAKGRYWWAVLYPENMIEDWEDHIDDLLQIPYEYCIHDKDLVNDPDEQRKVHVHIIIAFSNTTTYKNAFNTFDRLSKVGKNALNKCEQIVSIEYAHKYLIHDTDKCREKNKHLYAQEERKAGNLFDIGAYVQLNRAEEEEIFNDIVNTLYECCFDCFVDLDRYFRFNQEYESEDYRKYYMAVLRGHLRYFEALCKGIHFKKEQYRKLELNKAEERKKKIQRDSDFQNQLMTEAWDINSMTEDARKKFLESLEKKGLTVVRK